MQEDATELSFAGLMIRSREESFEQGRKALASAASGAECLVARGKTSGATMQTWIDTVAAPCDCHWTNLGAALGQALQQEPRAPAREIAPGSATTFLNAMRNAALCQEAVVRRQFLHAGKPYWLETRRSPEHLSGAGGRYPRSERRALRRVSHPSTRRETRAAFRVRIEYRPRSFLRLTFEAELEATLPTIPSVFPEESA